jgi:hypothetical protein
MRNWIIILIGLAGCTTVQEYSTCETWDELVRGESFHYVPLTRVSDPGSKEEPVYTGFWFYDEQQFDKSGRYALGMKVYFQVRDVVPSEMTGPISFAGRIISRPEKTVLCRGPFTMYRTMAGWP